MENMKKHNRRNFLLIIMSGIIGLIASIFQFKTAVKWKDKSLKDKSLKEADFYNKHNLAG